MRCNVTYWGIIALLLIACWPCWQWLAQRIGADPSEGLGLLTPLIAIAVCWRTKGTPVRAPLLLPALLLLAYTLGYQLLLPLARAVLAVSALAACLSAWRLGTRLHLALWGLLLLALPVIPSVQFFLGYPLRALVAVCAAPLLCLTGFAAQPQGACLQWGSQLVAIDAPCSGVKMLWGGGVLVLSLALALRLSPARTLWAGCGAIVAILVGNILRSAVLFYPEAGIVPMPGWGHGAVGMFVFCIVATCLAWWVRALARKGDSDSPAPPALPAIVRWEAAGFAIIAILAAAVPCQHAAAAAHPPDHFPGWPTQFAGQALHPLALSARETRFVGGFPGHIARFTDGRRELVLRWVTQDTRLLHPASDCFRGIGYHITPLPLATDAQQRCWGAFRAERAGHTLDVRELIYDDAGHSWSDVSAWYWSTALHRTPGPWWAVTVVSVSH